MAQVKIVTDSSAYLPESASIAQLGIEVIPLIVQARADRPTPNA